MEEDKKEKRDQYKEKIMMVTGDEKGRAPYTKGFTHGFYNRLK